MNIVGKKIGLSTQVFSAMILGAVFGLLFGGVMVKLEFIGTIWLNCIKMIVVPMVLMTIITGITSYNKIVVFIDRSPAECYNKFRMLWIGMYHLPQRRFSGGSNHSFFVEMLIS